MPLPRIFSLMTTVTLAVPTLRDLTRAAAGDWSPTLRRWAGTIAAVATAVYVAGFITGQRWHRFAAQARHLLTFLLARLGLPGGSCQGILGDCSGADVLDALAAAPLPVVPATARPIVHRLAPAPSPALSRRDACRRLRAQGLSPAAIGRELGVSRSTVRRELAV